MSGRDLSAQDFEDHFLQLITSVLSSLESTYTQPRPIPLAKTKPEAQALFMRSRNLLQGSKEMLDQYDLLSQQQPDPSSLQDLSTKFTEERVELKAAVAAGRRIAQIEIEVLLADRYHEVRCTAAGSTQDEQNGKKLIDVGMGQREEINGLRGWGNVAYKAQRRLEKLHKITVVEE